MANFVTDTQALVKFMMGIYRICKKYLTLSVSAKRLKDLSPAHSFRHSCAVNMLSLPVRRLLR